MLVGFAGYLEGGDPCQAAESGWAAALGMLLVILAEVVQAAQVGTAGAPACLLLLAVHRIEPAQTAHVPSSLQIPL